MQFLISFLVTLSIVSRAVAHDISCPPGQLPVSVEFGATQCADIPICVEGWPEGNCPPDSFCGVVRTGVHGCRLKNVLPPTEAPTTTVVPTEAPTTTVVPTNATTTVVPTNATTTVIPTNATTTVVPTNATTTVVPTNATTGAPTTSTTTGAPTTSTSGGARLRKLFGLF